MQTQENNGRRSHSRRTGFTKYCRDEKPSQARLVIFPNVLCHEPVLFEPDQQNIFSFRQFVFSWRRRHEFPAEGQKDETEQSRDTLADPAKFHGAKSKYDIGNDQKQIHTKLRTELVKVPCARVRNHFLQPDISSLHHEAAKPLTGPDPTRYRIEAAMNVVMFASRIAESARS